MTSHKLSKKGNPKNTWPTLLGDGSAAVLELPPNFSLAKALSSATEIRLATAFARQSGWNSFKDSVSTGKAKVFLLTGLDCFQTQPELLKDWLQRKLTAPDRVEACVASEGTFFHPKVFAVSFGGTQRDFAVVGSGNLSLGGLRDNTECGVFIDNAAVVKKVRDWFDAEFRLGLPLTPQLIAAYEQDYEKNKKKNADLKFAHAATTKKLQRVAEATMDEWNEAVKAAKTYFLTKSFEKSYALNQAGAQQIVKALHAPTFDFDRSGWIEFYSIKYLGHLDERQRDKVWKQQKRLKAALRAVVTGDENALTEVVDREGKLHVGGVGLNTVSKILAAISPDEWPVYNSRVAKALMRFGYQSPRGAGAAGKYLAYRNAMRKFVDACQSKDYAKIDALALDAFFYEQSKLGKTL
jgi:HKD family nuclease